MKQMIDNGITAAMARKIVIASGENVWDDYFNFYNDGKWLVEVLRKLISTLSGMKKGKTVNFLPKMEECMTYIYDIRLDELGTSDFKKRCRKMLSELKKVVDDDDSDKRIASIDDFLNYVREYEVSCVNAFRNRYAEDEEDANNLLNTIRDAGNYVLNG